MSTMYAEDVKRKVPFVLGRWPKTDLELWWFVKATWGVEIPRRAVCPGHVSPFRAFADSYFARYPVTVWKASRGFGGKTYLLSLLGQTELVALGAFVTILGGSGAQSQRVHESMAEFWEYENAPSYLLAREPTMYNTYLTNGGKARTLMASQKSVRGPHPQRMRLDEIDEMELEILRAAQGQPMRSKRRPDVDTQTTMSSTHQYPDKTMSVILEEAKERSWPVYHWCYRETSAPGGWLSKDEIERKKSEVSKAMWDTEYELQEPSFEGRAIDTASVDKAFYQVFTSDGKEVVYEGREGHYIEFEAPRNDREYVTGVDWAKEQDWTVIWTFDTTTTPWRWVAFQRMNRLPWPVMVSKANLRLARYGGRMCHDSTGIGNVVADLIEVPAKCLVGRRKRDVVTDFSMNGRKRDDMISEYVAAIEKNEIAGPRIQWAYDEHRYATNDDLFGRGHLPDSVAAGALAWHMRKRRERVQIASRLPNDDLSRPASPWKV